MPATDDNAAEARRLLHEDQVSDNVARVHKRLASKLWALYHARDYMLGVLQLLESLQLLRDTAAEQKAEERRASQLRVFGEAHTARENAYRELVLQVVHWSEVPGAVERLRLIDEARDREEYRQLTRRFESDELPRLVQEWREKRRLTAEAMLQRVHGLLDGKRKTVPMQALREALTPPAGRDVQ
jgi:hypothetical protein